MEVAAWNRRTPSRSKSSHRAGATLREAFCVDGNLYRHGTAISSWLAPSHGTRPARNWSVEATVPAIATTAHGTCNSSHHKREARHGLQSSLAGRRSAAHCSARSVTHAYSYHTRTCTPPSHFAAVAVSYRAVAPRLLIYYAQSAPPHLGINS